MVHADEPLANYDTLGVTIEPRGGSDAPTSSPVMLGSIVRSHTPTVADRQQMLQLIAPLRD